MGKSLCKKLWYSAAMSILSFLYFSNSLHAQCMPGDIGGTVFRELPANGLAGANTYGTMDANEPGFPGIMVTITDLNDAVLTTTTDNRGEWSVTPSAYPVRVEFSWSDDYLEATTGVANNQIVRIENAADCAINLGVQYPSDYAQPMPEVIVNCYVPGDPLGGGTSGTLDAVVTFPYGRTGTTPDPDKDVLMSEVGATWGLAYNPYTEVAFTSAVMKRHVGLGSLGIGGIYAIDYSGPSPVTTSFIDLAAMGINLGTEPGRNLSIDFNSPESDSLMFDTPGKTGMGDLDISDDGQTLYVVNLSGKEIVAIDLTNYNNSGTLPSMSDVSSLGLIPSPGCVFGSSRPFGLKYYQGQLYAGMVCSGENGGNASNLSATIYAYDFASNTWNTALATFPLDYTRGSESGCTQWEPWTDFYEDFEICGPAPLLSSIDFDVDGSMIMAFTDRYTLQKFSFQRNTTDTQSETVNNAGELLRAGFSAGTFSLESAGTTSNGGGCGTNGEGPDGGEFYCGDSVDPHNETAMGAVAILHGTEDVIATVINPVDGEFNSGGVKMFDNNNGTSANGYMLYQTTTFPGGNGNAAKGGGLGDIELMKNPAPVEVCSFLWIDSDNDGSYDAGESGLGGIEISLVATDGTVIETTTTDTEGGYCFTNTLEYFTDYYLAVGTNGDFDPMTGIIQDSLSLTFPDNTSGPTAELHDSDAIIASGVDPGVDGYPYIPFNTGGSGINTNDLATGFSVLVCPVINNPSAPQTICSGDTISNLQIETDATETDAIVFVYFTDQQVDADMYTGGISLDTITPIGGIATINDIVLPINNTASPEEYFIYAIANPVPGTVSCRPFAEITVTVSAAPAVNITSNSPVCEGEDIMLNEDGGVAVNWIWQGPSFSAGNIQNPIITNASAADDGMYYVTITDASGCTNVDSTSVSVTGSSSITFGNTGPFCIMQAPSDITAIPGGGTFTGTGITDATAGTFDPSIAGTGITTITYDFTDGNGCSGAATVDVVVLPSPTVTLDEAGPFCVTDPDTLLNGQPSGGTYMGSGITDGVNGRFDPGVAGPGMHAISYTFTNAQNCSETATINITVGAIPSVNAMDQGPFCRSNPPVMLMEGTPAGGLFYGQGITDTVNGIFDPALAIAGLNVIKYVINRADGCSNSADIRIMVPVPNIQISDAGPFCSTDPSTIIDATPTGGVFSGPGITDTINGIFNPGVAGAGDHVITYEYSDTTGCEGVGTNTITVADCNGNFGDFVWIDNNNNGVQEIGEAGFNNLTVNLYDANNDMLINTTTTNSSGIYSFTGLTSGNYYIIFDTTGISDQYMFSPMNIGSDDTDSDADAGGQTPDFMGTTGFDILNIDAGLVPIANIGDLVFNDLNNDGSQDAGEPGLEGITVNIYNANTDVIFATTTTDANGNYTLGRIPAGNYYLGYDATTNVNGDTFVFAPQDATTDNLDSDANPSTGFTPDFVFNPINGNNTDLDAGFVRAASIGDFVFADYNSNGAQDPGEPGIEGVMVILNNSSGTPLDTVFTDVNGNYEMAGITAGDFYLSFDPTTNTEGNSFLGTLIDATTEDLDSDIDPVAARTMVFTFDPTSGNIIDTDAGFIPVMTIGDFVFEDDNEDGIQGAGETGIEGVTVTLYNAADDAVIITTTTDAAGLYSFSNITSGNYYLGFDESTNTSGFNLGTSPQNNTATTEELDSDIDPETNLTASFIVDPLVGDDLTMDAGFFQLTIFSIGDFVWQDDNGNGSQDPGEPGLESVDIFLANAANDDVIDFATTDAAGAYQFDNVPAGNYYLFFDKDTNYPEYNFSPQDAAGNDALDNDADPDGQTANFTVTNADNFDFDAGLVPNIVASTIGDFVFEDADENGIQDMSETGIEGVTVTLFNSGDSLIATTTTDATGAYIFDDILAGDYYLNFDATTNTSGNMLTASPQDVTTTTEDLDSDINIMGNTDDFTFDALAPNNNIDAGFYQPAVPTNTLGDFTFEDTDANGIQDAGETGIEGITVTLFNPGDSLIATTTTDAMGAYTFDDIPAGDYYLSFDATTNTAGSMYTASPQDVTTTTEDLDSDINTMGNTEVFTFDGLAPNNDIDAGFFVCPVIDAGMDVTICEGTSTTLSATSGGMTYLWTPTATLDNPGSPTPVATPVVTTTYIVNVSGICNGADSVTVFVNPQSTIDMVDPVDPSACDEMDGSIQITANGGQTPLNYSIDGGSTFSTDNTFNNLSSGNYDVLVANADSTCTSPVQTVTLTQEVVTCPILFNNDTLLIADGQAPTVCIPVSIEDTMNYEIMVNGALYTDPITGCTVDTLATPGMEINLGGTGIYEIAINSMSTCCQDTLTLAVQETIIPDTLFEVTPFETTTTTLCADTSDLVGNFATLSLCQTPANGTSNLDGSSCITYTPDAGFTGTDELCLVACDEFGACDTTVIFIEVQADDTNNTNTIGDFVFEDTNKNGIQEMSETGIEGVTVNLFNPGDSLIATTTTDAMGTYSFDNILAGDYYINFAAATNTAGTMFTASPQNVVTTTEDLDSDINDTGNTEVFTFDASAPNNDIDAGFFPQGCPVFEAGPDVTICAGTSTQLSATLGGTTYSWSPAATLDNPASPVPVATPTATTTYTVTVSGTCSGTDMVTVFVNPQATIDMVNTVDPSACDAMDGSIQIIASGGQAPLNYSIDGGMTFSTNNTYSNLSAGNYDVLIANADSTCMSPVQSVVLTQEAVSCPFLFSNDTLLVADGRAPTVCIPVSIDDTINYEITVNGALYTDPITGCTVDTLATPGMEINLGGTGIYEIAFNNTSTCCQDTLTLAVQGTIVPDTLFEVTPFETTTTTLCADTSDLVGDFATLALCQTPANGTANLDGSSCITYTPDAGFTGTDTLCLAACDEFGACDTTVMFIEVQVDNTDNTNTIGDFVFEDTNENGIQDSIEIGIEGVTVTLIDDNTGLPFGMATLTDGAGMYRFDDVPAGDYFVNFDVTTNTMGNTFTVSPQNVMTTTEDSDSDINDTGDTEVFSFDALAPNNDIDAGFYQSCPDIEAGPDVTICAGTSTTLSATPGGTTYLWTPTGTLDNPGSPTPVATPLMTTTYFVNVSGTCNGSDSITVFVNPQSAIDMVNSTDPSSCDAMDGSIQIMASGGQAPLNYSIDGGITFSTDNNFGNLSAGNYDVLIANADSTCMSPVQSVALNQEAASCPILFSNDTLLVADGRAPTVCIPVSIDDTMNYEITVNGALYTDPITGCTVDTLATPGMEINLGGIGIYEIAFNNTSTCCQDTLTLAVQGTIVPDTIFQVTPFETTTSTLCADTSDLVGNFATLSLCQTPGNGTANLDGSSCITYTPDSGFMGTDTLCLVACDEFGACDTTVLFIQVQTEICPDIITLENEMITLANCSDNGTICVNIDPVDLGQYTFFDNGNPYGGGIQPCRFDMLTYYEYEGLPGDGLTGPYRVDNWTVNGMSFSGTVADMESLKDSMNIWDPTGNWIHVPENNEIRHLQTTDTYSDINLTEVISGSGGIMERKQRNQPMDIELSFGVGTHEVIIRESATGCEDTVNVILTCACPPLFAADTITVEAADCGEMAFYCTPILLTDFANYNVLDNGNPYTQQIGGCDFDSLIIYNYNNFPNQGNSGPYELESWIVDGQTFSMTFNTIPELVDSMNIWDLNGNWFISSNLSIDGGDLTRDFNEYGAITIVQFGEVVATSPADLQETPSKASLPLSVGFHELVFENTDAGCSDTIYVNATCDDCPEYFMDEMRTLDAADCADSIELCMAILPADITNYTITDNGAVYNNGFTGCDFDSIQSYLTISFNDAGSYQMDSWLIEGIAFGPVSFTDPSVLADSMNIIDPTGNWNYSGLLITGGSTLNTYGDMTISENGAPLATITPSPILRSNGTAMLLDTGFHQVIVTDDLSGCTDTIAVQVDCTPAEDCPAFLNVASQLFFSLDDCNEVATACMPVSVNDAIRYTITDNGIPYPNTLTACNADIVLTYETERVPGSGPYNLEEWTINGMTFNGAFDDLDALADSMNVWDTGGSWNFDPTAQTITGANPGNTYGTLNIRQLLTSSLVVLPTVEVTVGGGTNLELMAGFHEMIFERPDGCMDTVAITVECPNPDTVLVDLVIGITDTICLDTNSLVGNIIDIDNICPDASGSSASINFLDEFNCVEVTGIEVGVDTACIVLCDDLGVCDTTTFVFNTRSDQVSPPVANPDTANTLIEVSVDVVVVNNDDAGNQLIDTFYIVEGPDNGTAFLNPETGLLTYTPFAGYCDEDAPDELTYGICNASGCDSATVSILVLCDSIRELVVRNGFSPNNDGVNDRFMIQGLRNIPNNSLTIYNRWGNLVYQKDAYGYNESGQYDENTLWDGNWTEQILPDGTYFYLLDDGNGNKYSGYVQIQR